VRNSGLPDGRPPLIGLTVSTGGPKTLFLQTLSLHDAPLYRSLVDGLTIAPTNDDVLYASVGMHSLNGGATWSRDGNAGQVLAVHPQFPRVALGSGEGGIWKTRDATATWRKLATLECLRIRNIVIDPQTPANLYALGDFLIGCAPLPFPRTACRAAAPCSGSRACVSRRPIRRFCSP
jgi:hypothetical protein